MRLKHDHKKAYLVVLALTMVGGFLLSFRIPVSARQATSEAAGPSGAAILQAHVRFGFSARHRKLQCLLLCE